MKCFTHQTVQLVIHSMQIIDESFLAMHTCLYDAHMLVSADPYTPNDMFIFFHG